MSPIQQMLLGLGAVATKTYVDDIFTTNLYVGDGANSRTITTGLDLSTEGGMTWLRDRGGNVSNMLFDTVRGARKPLNSGNNGAEQSYPSGKSLTGWTTTGFTLGTNHNTENWSGYDYVNWNFRESPGFFDVVQFTETNSDLAVSHSLGCIPGMIIMKRKNGTSDWIVYHRDVLDGALKLNTTAAREDLGTDWCPVSNSTFTFKPTDVGTGVGSEWVAYVFAGGEEGYNSVNFNKASSLQLASNADLSPGTGDFTFECWLYPTQAFGSSWETIYHNGVLNGLYIGKDDADDFVVRASNNTNFIAQSTLPSVNQWTHIAVTRSGSTLRLFYDGVLKNTVSNSHNFLTAATGIGQTSPYPGEGIAAKISNLRFVKGTAVYTSAFTPPTAPLTNITNTKLLCCNGDLTTSSTVTPETITNNPNGIPNTGRTSPFTSPDAVFGENEDQNVIKCGTYIGNGSATGPEINLGWEPQWILIKRASGGTGEWLLYDALRGISTGGPDAKLAPNTTDAEFSYDYLDLTSTGFKINVDYNFLNDSGDNYVYVAIRRSDGYVGKPPALGTGVFAMDTGAGSSTIPNYDSGFVVDLALARVISSSDDWGLGARLISGKRLKTNESEEAGSQPAFTFDSNVGWNNNSSEGSSSQAWMWKRHAGMDVVCYEGNGAVRQISHGLSKSPEMIWIKKRNSTSSSAWIIYHKGLNGGTNPENYILKFDTNAEASASSRFADTAPTSSVFSLGAANSTNQNDHTFIAMLFASVDGISKVGYYNGTGSSGHSITTGFQPRFIVIKAAHRADGYGGGWHEFDTLRGINSGNEYPLSLNSNAAEDAMNHLDYIDLDSDGFTIQSTSLSFNGSNARYIYYAHA